MISKSLSFEILKCIIDHKNSLLLFMNWQAPFIHFIFLWNCLPNTQFWISIVFLSLIIQVKTVFHKKNVQIQLKTQICKWCSWRQSPCGGQWKCCTNSSSCVTDNSATTWSQKWKILGHCHYFIKHVLKGHSSFLTSTTLWRQHCLMAAVPDGIALIHNVANGQQISISPKSPCNPQHPRRVSGTRRFPRTRIWMSL